MKIKLFYFYDGGQWVDDDMRIEVSTIDWRGDYQGDRVFIQELEVEVPDCRIPSKEEIANGMIAILKDEKSRILAETHKKVSEIEDKIQQLLCIEFQPDGDKQ